MPMMRIFFQVLYITFEYRTILMLFNLEKNKSTGPENLQSQPQCKKIQDYVYRFSDQIGMGNFSKVFKGTHQTTNKQVAIKIIELNSLTSSRLQELLNTQTKILKMLSHPNVIGCEQILSSIRNCYIITQLCNGGDLEKKLKKIGSFKEKQIYHIVTDIYQGLKYLSKKHIIHRDIKVSNIFINNGIYKIADFGFAQISQTQFKDISVGSPIYMSPEGYINNLYGPKTDVWAFGMLLYELVQGRTPYYDCRTENQLRNRLMKQIDYSNFSSQISSELKNLIIQCLQINPTVRIRALDIQNTQWMRKAMKVVNQSQKTIEKQKIQKPNICSHTYKKTFQQITTKHTDHKVQASMPNENFQPLLKNIPHKHSNNYLKTSEKQQNQSEHKRKHSTLDKTVKVQGTDKRNNQSSNIFYSPKNVILKFQKTLGFKSITPAHKFDSYDIKNLTSPDHHKLVIKNDSLKLDNTNRQDNNVSKIRNLWIYDKNVVKQNKDTIKLDQKYKKEKQKHNITSKNSFFQPKQNKQQNKNKQLKIADKLNIAHYYKNYINHNNNLNHNQNFQKIIIKNKNSQQNHLNKKQKQKENQEHEIRTTIKYGDKKNLQKQWHLDTLQSQKGRKSQNNSDKKMQKRSFSTSNLSKVIPRIIKFSDCIGIIHYCRLCYKFACLLDQYGENDQTKQFLTAWSAQLLLQIFNKLEDSQIIFGSEKGLMNNPSAHVNGQTDKKKKLKDVIQQYLGKYLGVLKNHDMPFISFKQASNFIYNLYFTKGHEFKQKSKDKKSYLYFALICYISMLDKQTRNFMEYIYQIKNSLQGKQIEKLLNIRINDFNRNIVQEIIGEGNQNHTQS